jgi:hypothetical protein
LPTTNSGKTIFHVILAGDVFDKSLIQRMVASGGLVNLTDVHGTTPFMDVIRSKEKTRAAEAFSLLTGLGKVRKDLVVELL